jgi:3-hexulose-6-phosphate synthase/6-phospho-3-hexuloisomerase
MKPILQVALDFVQMDRALKLAAEAVAGGADWLEAGTPLIKSVGLDCVRELRRQFPHHTIVADMKTMDIGRIEVESAAKAGADVVDVLAVASDSTIEECVRSAAHYGSRIMVDLVEARGIPERARRVEEIGADYLAFHISIDEQMQGTIRFSAVRELVEQVSIPVAVAGGIHSENACEAMEAGASILIVGGAITKSGNAHKAAEAIKTAMERKTSVSTNGLFKRVSNENVRDALRRVSTANVSDAMHRQCPLKEIRSVTSTGRMVGRAFTVRTYPGDWAKPVEAIDLAQEGDVIVVDAGGVGPAVWGELASQSARQKGLAGAVIDGAIRDVDEIRRVNFPAFAKIITPAAGEPKGFGEIGVPVDIGGQRVFPRDWVIGDEDGVMIIPWKNAAGLANRAMDILERENRIRKEIQDGSTLGRLTELLKWEKT